MGVTVRVVGGLAVHDGADVACPGAPIALPGRKARRLLAMLVAARGRSVSATAAVAELWGARPPRRPEDNVAVLVSRLRAGLGADAVVGGRDGYRLGGEPAVRVDLDLVVRHAADVREATTAGDPARALRAAEAGLDLLARGEALEGEADADWVGALRAEAEDLRRALRHGLAEAALAVGDPPRAVAAASSAAAADPLDDTAHRLLMSAHHAAGQPARALRAYERLRATLAEELGVDPAPETRERHLAILRGRAPAAPGPRPTVGPPVDRRGAATTARPDVVGRDDELARLVAAWSDCRARGAALWLLVGEAGIGKTTLAETVAEVAAGDGATVLRARAHATERSLFLQPVLDALIPSLRACPAEELCVLAGQHAPVLAGLVPELARAWGTRVAEVEGDVFRGRAFAALRGLLEAMATRRPVLFVIDDLHEAGTATTEFLHYAARRLGRAPVLLLAAVRDGEGDAALVALDDVARRLPLGPLGPEAVALLAARAGVPRHAEDVVRRTRGHPLSVTESLRALAAGEDGVPGSLQEAVVSRLRHLRDAVADALRAAAVLGSAPSPEIVAAMLDLPTVEVLHRFERATAAHVLRRTETRYEFANDLVREIVYASTSGPVRAAHHGVAADLLAGRPEALAGHAAEIGDLARAARAWLVAGQRALGRGAAGDALAVLDTALEAAAEVDDPVLHGRVHLVRSHALDALADATATEAGVSAAIAAMRDVPDADPSPAAPLGGRVTAGLDGARRVAEARIDRSAEAETCGWRAVAASNRLRFTEALAWGRRAVTAARETGDDGALLAALDGLKTPLAYTGDVGALGRVLAELAPLARRRGERQILFWTIFESALPVLAAGDAAAAAARVREAREVCRGGGLEGFEPWFGAHLALMARVDGRLDEAVDLARSAVATDERHPWWWPTAASQLGTALLARADPHDVAEAVEVLGEGLALAEQGGTEAYVLRCLAPLAQATRDDVLLERAERLVAAIDAPPRSAWFGGADAYLAVARAHVARGDRHRARSVVRPLAVAAGHHGWVLWRSADAVVDEALAASR
ncbi:ATP-binding protein [Actinomycetospora cinnamomea]|uniref:Transcriptional regulator n=1 Tax=Actinomycetospora cinnamomea TaxID=663609 RepID=A0A2U1F9I8_9PSEU|nr:BTAD domain-containing putative transcriptional regulator [Actinomycetospora cinnamomea]PVZ08863.1 transcriptional regulator [Actinomycetospora cinnamomea]